jgi:hypothetical protein
VGGPKVDVDGERTPTQEESVFMLVVRQHPVIVEGGHAVTDKPRDVAVKISWRWSQLTDLIGLWTRVEAAHGDGELHEQLVDAVKALVDSLYEAVVGNIPTHMVLPRQDGGKLWFAPLKGERKMKLLDTSALPPWRSMSGPTRGRRRAETTAKLSYRAADLLFPRHRDHPAGLTACLI